VIVRFLDIGGIVEHLNLNFLFKTIQKLPLINTIPNYKKKQIFKQIKINIETKINNI
jgi:hypothetical protein